MLLSAAKLVRWVHKLIVTDALLSIPSDFGRTSVSYRKMLRELCQLAVGEGITLKRIKADASIHPYFRLNGNSDEVAQAVWEARKQYISYIGKEREKVTESSTESTSNDSDSADSTEKTDSTDE